MRARSEAISPTSFSARSAAVACSASGRSRFLTSASTSRARSAWIATRCSFSSARWRWRLKRPSPAASSIISRRRSGDDDEHLLDLALPDDRVHPAAEPEVREQLDEVDPAHARAVDEVLPLAAAVQPARDRELRELDRPVAVRVVEQQLDLAVVGRLAARPRRRRARRRASPRAARRARASRPPRRSRRRRSTSLSRSARRPRPRRARAGFPPDRGTT